MKEANLILFEATNFYLRPQRSQTQIPLNVGLLAGKKRNFKKNIMSKSSQTQQITESDSEESTQNEGGEKILKWKY